MQDPETFWSYEYDEENRLRYAESYDQYDSLDIWYDALGRRIFTYDFSMYGPHQGPVDHVFSGLSVIEEYQIAVSSTVPAREFVWGTSFTEPVVMIDHTSAGAVGAGTAEVLHYLQGALGSVTALTDDSGMVVERYFYDPYGKTYIYNSGGTLLSQSAFGNPFMWTGQRYDPSVKLYHFWARTYSPALGRWLQRDPLGYVDGVGLYEYVAGNPLGRTDPLGLWYGIWLGAHVPPATQPILGKPRDFRGTPGPIVPALRSCNRTYDTSNWDPAEMHTKLYELYSNRNSRKNSTTDTAVLGGDFLLDVRGQSELLAYRESVIRQLLHDAEAANAGGHRSFRDNGTTTITADLLSTNVRLSLQRFTAGWSAIGTIDESGIYHCTICWFVYDFYDFQWWEPYGWDGLEFQILGFWEEVAGGSVEVEK